MHFDQLFCTVSLKRSVYLTYDQSQHTFMAVGPQLWLVLLCNRTSRASNLALTVGRMVQRHVDGATGMCLVSRRVRYTRDSLTVCSLHTLIMVALLTLRSRYAATQSESKSDWASVIHLPDLIQNLYVATGSDWKSALASLIQIYQAWSKIYIFATGSESKSDWASIIYMPGLIQNLYVACLGRDLKSTWTSIIHF